MRPEEPDPSPILDRPSQRILAAITDGLLCLANVPRADLGHGATSPDWRRSRATDWDAELRLLTSTRPPS